MTLKVTAFDPALDFKIIHQTETVNTANVNVAGGACQLLSIDVDNTGGAAACFLRLYDGDGPSVGATFPQMSFNCAAGNSLRVSIPSGIPYTNLNFWVTRNASELDNTAPAMVGSNKVLTTLLVQPE